jgi:ankyrin repeat protein
MADEHENAVGRERIEDAVAALRADGSGLRWGLRVHASLVLGIVAFLWAGRRLYPRFWTRILNMVFQGMAFQGDNRGIWFLLRLGADVNGRDELPGGATPLIWAAHAGRAETVRLLLALGAELDAPDDHGATALVRAVETGQTGTVCLLLVNGASPNARGFADLPALALAAGDGDVAMLEALHARGAEVNALGRHPSVTAVRWAAINGQEENLRWLLAHGARG